MFTCGPALLCPAVSGPVGPPSANWVGRPNIADVSWDGIAVNSSVFVVVGRDDIDESARVATSTDGTSWTARTFPANTVIPRGVIWDSRNSLFIAYGTAASASNMLTSPDGITWTLRSSGASEGINSMAGNADCVVAMCNNRAASFLVTRILRSTNGTSWSFVTNPIGGYSDFYDTCWSASLGLFVAVGLQYEVGFESLTSADGTSWTEVTGLPFQGRGVAAQGGLLVMVGGAPGDVATSTDGATWTTRTASSLNDWIALASNGTTVVAVGQYAATTDTAMVSYDGITWVDDNAANANNWADVCYGLGIFAAVGSALDGDSIMTRP